jgi:sugar lactone lactonase YvrE
LVLVGMYTPDSYAQWVNGQNAEYVVGQTDFNSNDTGVSSTLLGTLGSHAVAIDFVNHKMYLSDPINYRVLRYPYPVTSNGMAADLVFGQVSLDSNAAPPNTSTASSLRRPWGLAVHNGDLWVVERYDARILRYQHAWSDASNAPAADLVLGVPDFATLNPGTSQTQLSQPRNICFDASGNLWVADGNNNRVLEYVNASSKANGAPADKVLGQSNYTSSAVPAPPTSSSMNTPYGVYFEGSTLWVADGDNNRVLRFDNAASKANGAAADRVLGQTDFVSSASNSTTAATMAVPTALVVDGNGTLYLCDYGYNRVLIYENALSKANGGSADVVLGQNNFTSSSSGLSQSTLNLPNGIGIDVPNGKLIVCDERNYRVLQFSASNHPLPIQLSSFAASASGDGVRLTWTTMSEVNNYGFEVQRSPASAVKQWTKAGFVPGYGTSTTAHSYSFVDTSAGVSSSYRLKQIDLNGESRFSDPVDVNSVAGAAGEKPVPEAFLLTQNYPNPFNPSTQIEYDLPKAGQVSLVVYDILGREVTTLASGYHEAGRYTARWDAGAQASGVYIARVKISGEAGGTVFTKNIKLLLTK